ncbi:hypothetical protein PMAYCL1PPCAC_16542, partial [Pristionchus mayeri]
GKVPKLFELEKIEQNLLRATRLSTSFQQSPKSAYGGLIMAQALSAAESTLSESFKPHSMHSYFIMSVDPALAVDYRVRRLRDGKSLCSRSVEATQNGNIVFTMQASFQAIDEKLRPCVLR